MSAKSRRQLLLPSGRKTAADRAMSLKHNPMEEFRDSIYRAKDPDAPTLVTQKSTAFKSAAKGAALDLPGAKKAQIGRLVYVVGDEVPIYGTPQLMMSVTRNSDVKKTPDIRTRAILPQWCAIITVRYVEPLLKPEVIGKLFAAAGFTQGIGDWRVEKGSGNYGTYELVAEDDPRVKILMQTGNREAQVEAMENPETYDSESDQLLSWFNEEIDRRGLKAVK
jgi:hypothetical protein